MGAYCFRKSAALSAAVGLFCFGDEYVLISVAPQSFFVTNSFAILGRFLANPGKFLFEKGER